MQRTVVIRPTVNDFLIFEFVAEDDRDRVLINRLWFMEGVDLFYKAMLP